MSKYILDPDGNPVYESDLMNWANWFENSREECQIGFVLYPKEGVRVSTVFLALDYNFGVGKPILFETMIFGGKHDNYIERYSTREEAVAGHARAVKLVEDSLNS